MTWIVTANTNTCRIYSYDKNHSKISLLKEIQHPEMRLKTSDTLTSDRPGHYQTNGSARGAYSPHTEAKAVEIDNFSREIAEELDKGRKANSYEKLILISAPHMHGLINHHLNKHVKNLVINNIEKDFLHLNERELVEFLQTHMQYPDE
jgi:protein required for attachment to host cells